MEIALEALKWVAVAFAISVLLCLLVFAAFVFVGEPLGPSRRVRVHWDRESFGKLRRYLGPGILRAVSLLLLLGLGCLVAQTLSGAALCWAT